MYGWMDGWVLECVCEYVRVCVRACVRMCAHARVRACVCARVSHGWVRACVGSFCACVGSFARACWMCACVRVRVRAWVVPVHACVRSWVRACMGTCVYGCVHGCMDGCECVWVCAWMGARVWGLGRGAHSSQTTKRFPVCDHASMWRYYPPVPPLEQSRLAPFGAVAGYRADWEPAATSGKSMAGVPGVFWRCPAVLQGPSTHNPTLVAGKTLILKNWPIFPICMWK